MCVVNQRSRDRHAEVTRKLWASPEYRERHARGLREMWRKHKSEGRVHRPPTRSGVLKYGVPKRIDGKLNPEYQRRMRASFTPQQKLDDNRRHREYRNKFRERARAWMWRAHLKFDYGLTPEQFESMMKAQDGKCAICGSGGHGNIRNRLCVDHCHKTKKVRGLLCRYCNIVLGVAKDNPKILKKAVAYLESHIHG